MTFVPMNDSAAGSADAALGPVVTSTPAGSPAPQGLPPFSIQWAAGFIDGEAYIGLVKQTQKDKRRNPTYRVDLRVDQNRLAVLEHLKAGLGGAGSISKGPRKRQHRRQVYTYQLTGINALRALQALRPHLIRKGPEADALLAFWREAHGGERPGGKGWPPEVHALRERFRLQLQDLK